MAVLPGVWTLDPHGFQERTLKTTAALVGVALASLVLAGASCVPVDAGNGAHGCLVSGDGCGGEQLCRAEILAFAAQPSRVHAGTAVTIAWTATCADAIRIE